MPLRLRGAQALTFRVANIPSQWVSFQSGFCGLRSPRTGHPFAGKGRLFGTSTLPLDRPLRPSVFHLRITALSVPLSSTFPQACQSLSRPPFHRPVSPSLVHLSTGLSVPLSSTSPQACQSLSRPPFHRLSVPLSSTSPQACQSLARPHLHTSPHPMRLSLHINQGCLVGDSLSLHSVFCRASPCIDSCTRLTVLSSKNLPLLNTLSSEVASLH